MDWRTFTNPFDIQVLLASIRFSRRYFETEALKVFRLVETAPGAALQTDEQLIQWLRQNTSPSNAHTCCTLSLGAASDSRARLKGVEGVRIADASVWPFVPGAHATQQTAYVVAEKVSRVRVQVDGADLFVGCRFDQGGCRILWLGRSGYG